MTATYSPIAAPVRSAIRSAFAPEGGLKPAIDWNFAGGVMPAALTFARASTATYYDASGTLVTAASGSPRLTYDPVTHAALGVFVEEQRTNLLLYSQTLTDAAITKSNSSVVAASATAPDGTLTGFKLREDSTASADHRIFWTVTTTAVGHVLSVFAKAAERSWMYIRMDRSGGGTPRVWFDLSNGVVGTAETGTSGAITSVGGGWYRCSLILDTAAAGSVNPLIGIATANGATAYSGDGSSGIYVWGAQLEAGAFATSYIPTGAASATRAADVVTCTGAAFSQWFNPSEGTLVVEAVMPNADLGPAAVLNLVYVGDGPGNEYIEVYQYETVFGAAIRHSGAWQADLSGTKTAGVVEKIAVAWAANDAAVAIRGSLVGTDATVALPTGIDRLTLGTGSPGAVACTIKRVRYWRKRLTNAQLQALTA